MSTIHRLEIHLRWRSRELQDRLIRRALPRLAAMDQGDAFVTVLAVGLRRRRFLRYYRRMSAAGLAPEIVEVRRGPLTSALITRRHLTLVDWLASEPQAGEVDAMRERIVRQVELMHHLGISHRDLHAGNIVLDGARPLIIDPEFATRCDPRRPCYDLFGPSRSGVRVPRAHQLQDDLCHTGIWWSTAASTISGTLGTTFGSVDGPHAAVRLDPVATAPGMLDRLALAGLPV